MSQTTMLAPVPRIKSVPQVVDTPKVAPVEAPLEPVSPPVQILIEAQKVSVFYGAHGAIKSVSVSIPAALLIMPTPAPGFISLRPHRVRLPTPRV